MSAYGGLGPMTNAIHWVMVVIFTVFVGLRLYTRKYILNSIGVDDYLVILALALQILYTCFVTVASLYGLGRLFADVGDPITYSMAVKYEVFSQVAGIMVIGVGKLAVGMFLLRIVRNKIQIWFIWGCLATTVFITLFASICVVIQCLPVQKTWNPTVEGNCWLDFSKVGFTVGSWFVAADFSFAILPWFVVWDLNMKRKEKITIACALSLGVFAGVCGIVRTVALDDTVPMLIWSSTESCVTIMCSSIAVLRPLYVRIKYGKDGKSGYSGSDNSYKLPMYGSGRNAPRLSTSGLDFSTVEPKSPSHHAASVPFTTRNTSDETILRGAAGIERTDEISVSYEAMGRKV
ncbi:hypothetical protein FE257_003597 [Aspergillus nanangensis]|uniref:Rhodopsin domain-containing protein n=1 Tax=Aspergillus nanangensis TaxID=2582783 RepID=A0AAD4CRV4_ASPNN|nr:hypothetical protein FE257_003597 [Aspergillus nanangensis]